LATAFAFVWASAVCEFAWAWASIMYSKGTIVAIPSAMASIAHKITFFSTIGFSPLT
jgi:hypothetical protein